MFFGTRVGRFATQYLFIPFGGAFVMVEGAKHIYHLLRGVDSHAATHSVSDVFVWVLGIGLFLNALIHLPRFRTLLMSFFRTVVRGSKSLFVDLPLRLYQLPLVKKILRSTFVRYLRFYVIQPGLVTLVLFQVLPALVHLLVPSVNRAQWMTTGFIFVLLSAALNSRFGRDMQEWTLEWIGRNWQQLQAAVFVAIFDWIYGFFKWLLNHLERLIYAVDAWLRFRSGDSGLTLGVKAVLGVLWSFVVFLVRIYVNLLIEPQVNPIKHFPVVTVSHKIILPLTIWAHPKLVAPLTPIFGYVFANFLVGTTLFLLPGVFGFLVWELKENWRLYEANRHPELQPALVGSHGETMRRMLKPGFHSGTLPKLFGRLRRIQSRPASFRRYSGRRGMLEQLHHYEVSLQRHFDRELLALLDESLTFAGLELKVARVRATSNSVTVDIACDSLGEQPLAITLQEQSGWLVGAITENGWLNSLSRSQRENFLVALAGFYRLTGVDLVREQIRECFEPPMPPYDIRSSGMVVWPDSRYEAEASYDLRKRPRIYPAPWSVAHRFNLPVVTRKSLVFAETPVLWDEWVTWWSDPESAKERVKHLHPDALSLLPVGLT